MRVSLEQAIEERGILVDDELHHDLCTIMQEKAHSMSKELPQGSFAQVFWENQLQATRVKDARSMRWDPIMIRWCLYLRHLSGGAYDMIRDAGVVKLPSQRTLRDYTYHIKASVGFSDEVDTHLVTSARLDSCPERERCIVILMDEMYVREDIVYDRTTGKQE